MAQMEAVESRLDDLEDADTGRDDWADYSWSPIWFWHTTRSP